jgi:hypothetical protein
MLFNIPFAGLSNATTSPNSDTVLRRIETLCRASEEWVNIFLTFRISPNSVARMFARAVSRSVMALTTLWKISASRISKRFTAASKVQLERLCVGAKLIGLLFSAVWRCFIFDATRAFFLCCPLTINRFTKLAISEHLEADNKRVFYLLLKLGFKIAGF